MAQAPGMAFVAILAVSLLIAAAAAAGCGKLKPARFLSDSNEWCAPISELHYYEGQPANLSCQRAPGATNVSVQIHYYSTETGTVFTSFQLEESLEMYLKLSRAHNDTVVTCSARVPGGGDHNVQLRLLMRPDTYMQGFEVSGLRLPATELARPDGERELRHQYRYLAGERMAVRLVWDARAYDGVHCRVLGDNSPDAWRENVTSAGPRVGVRLRDASLLAEQSGTELRCRARRVDRADLFAPDLHLTLTFIYHELEPFAQGMILAMSSVEMMYPKRSTPTLYYEAGDAADTKNYLATTTVGQWGWNSEEVDIEPRELGENEVPRGFRMRAGVLWSLLEWRPAGGSRAVNVWLHRRPGPRQAELPDPDSPRTAKEFRFDYEFIEAADGWMKLHIVPSTWREARMRCHAEGAVLASPLTMQLKRALLLFVLRKEMNTHYTIFTGVHAIFHKGVFTSIEGVPLTRMPITWAAGEPDNIDNEESCLALATDADASISDVKCNDVLPYVCYKKYTSLTMNVCGTTDPAYKLEPRTGSCYKFHRRGLVWDQAFMTCHAEGGHLAIINSEEESKVIREIFEKNPNDTIRSTYPGALGVGFHDWGEHMTFLTIHGETLDEAGFQVWAKDQPDNSTRARSEDLGEFCGAVFRDGLLSDLWCNVPIPFLCEKTRDSLYA